MESHVYHHWDNDGFYYWTLILTVYVKEILVLDKEFVRQVNLFSVSLYY